MNLSELTWGIIGLLLTIMVLSYLIGDNFFFRLAAYIFVGLTAGYIAVLLITEILLPRLIQPLVSGSIQSQIWVIIPLILVLLLFLGQIRRFSALSSIPLAYVAGVAAALAIGGAVFGTLLPQSLAVISAFDTTIWAQAPGSPWWRILEAVVMLIGVLGTLSYFHFGRKIKINSQHDADKRSFLFEALSKVGQVFIGMTLGAVFAGVFSSALIALIDRILFIGRMIPSLLGGG